MKNKDDQILVRSVYLFYDRIKHKLVAAQSKEYHAIPFVCSPAPKTASERYSFRMYPTNNLYYIISNGGVELTREQAKALLEIRDKVVGGDNMSRIENESTATLSREEIHTLITEIDKHISKHQLEIIAEKQQFIDESLI